MPTPTKSEVHARAGGTQHATDRDGTPMPVPVSLARLSHGARASPKRRREVERTSARASQSCTTPHATWEPPSVCSSSTRRFSTRGEDVPTPSRGQGVRDAAPQPAPAQLHTRARAVCRARAGLTPRLEPPHQRRPSAQKQHARAASSRGACETPPRNVRLRDSALAACAGGAWGRERAALTVDSKCQRRRVLAAAARTSLCGVAIGALARGARTSRTGRGLV
ncbi:hypothetical protein C8J57DRAFT_1542501 [Mycena rebaudengoi]|nr:hypothetical protein C8J57DRAFT_1542501 [Mycena rebaudengoi]